MKKKKTGTIFLISSTFKFDIYKLAVDNATKLNTHMKNLDESRDDGKFTYNH